MKRIIILVLMLIILFPICSYGINERVDPYNRDDGTYNGRNTLEMPWKEFYTYFTDKKNKNYGHLFTLKELERFLDRTNRSIGYSRS